jgi:hypothetical protein
MRMRSWLIAALLVLSASTQQAQAQAKASKAAAAAEADDAEKNRNKPISVALLAGYGLSLSTPNHLNPFGIGFGVRGGYNLGSLYLGARFLFFLGDSEEIAGVDASANSITLGLETGYDLELIEQALVLRPEVGGGLVVQSAESMISDATAGTEMPMDESSEVLYIAPGLALLVKVGRRSFVGVDVQVPIIFDRETVIELTMLATGGLRF